MGYLKGLAIFVTAGTIIGGVTAVALDWPFVEDKGPRPEVYYETVEEINDEKLSLINSITGIELKGDKPISAEIIAEALRRNYYVEVIHFNDGFSYFIQEDNSGFRHVTESQIETAPSFMLWKHEKIGDIDHFSEATMEEIRKICINEQHKTVGVIVRGKGVYILFPRM